MVLIYLSLIKMVLIYLSLIKMTDKLCGLCFGNYSNLKQHLTVSHKIPNQKEFKLLLNYGCARTTERLDCKLCAKKALVRLDKHLQESHSMSSVKEGESILREAKRTAIANKIAKLRASNPDKPLVSSMDLGIMDPGLERENSDINEEQSEHFVSPDQSQGLEDENSDKNFSEGQDQSETLAVKWTVGSDLDNENTLSQPLHSTPVSASFNSSSTSARSSFRSQGCNSESDPRSCSSRIAKLQSRFKKGVKKKWLFEKIVEDYQTFQLGSRDGYKDTENARQSASHAHRFCLYMSADLPYSSICNDLRFLNRMDRLRTWPTYLAKKGYAATTIKNMMTNVVMFLKHVQSSFMPVCKLKQKELTTIQYEMKRIQSDVQRQVVVHRQKVLRKKTDNQLDANQSSKFMTSARMKIAELIQGLSEAETPKNQHALLLGYILCYLAILTGHRSVVFTNMTKDSVTNCESWDDRKDGKNFQILVDDHKTTKSFGQVSVCVNKEEYGWLKHLSDGRCCVGGQGSSYVFHTTRGNQIQKPYIYIHLAWKDSGGKDTITFNKIRSSVSTQANEHLSEKQRKQVANAMCHDSVTAERFYVALPDKKKAFQTRKLRMKALSVQCQKDVVEEATLSGSENSTSDDEQPVYDDSPDITKESSSEETNSSRKRQSSVKNNKMEAKRKKGKAEVSSSEEELSLSEEDLSFSEEDLSMQNLSTKRKLQFSPKSSEMFTLSECSVILDKLSKPIANFNLNQMNESEKRGGEEPEKRGGEVIDEDQSYCAAYT